MNYLMFQQSGEGQSLKIPDGLKELMSDISREVLREQPESIYEFIADYLEEMEITREYKGIAENVLSMVIDESVTVYELFKESGISLEHAKKSAKIIENSFKEYTQNKNMKQGDQAKSSKAMEKILEKDVCRKILQSCDLTREQDQQLRKIVQMCFKSFYFREKAYTFKATRLPDSHWANRAEKTLDLYRRSAPEKCKLDKAAVVIQSAYRSFFVRKMPKEVQRFHECATKIQARFRSYVAQKELQRAKAAAVKIQALYRGFSTRKALLIQRQYELEQEPILIMADIVNELVDNSITDDMDDSVIPDSGEDGNFVASSKEDTAARIIQKVYRGFQEKKKITFCVDKSDSNSMDQSNQPMLDTPEEQILDGSDSVQDTI